MTPVYQHHAPHTLASRVYGPQPHMRSYSATGPVHIHGSRREPTPCHTWRLHFKFSGTLRSSSGTRMTTLPGPAGRTATARSARRRVRFCCTPLSTFSRCFNSTGEGLPATVPSSPRGYFLHGLIFVLSLARRGAAGRRPRLRRLQLPVVLRRNVLRSGLGLRLVRRSAQPLGWNLSRLS